MRIYSIFLALLCFWGSSLSASAQKIIHKRYEISQEKEDPLVRAVVPVKTLGVAVITSEMSNFKANSRPWHLTLLDTNLSVKVKTSYNISKNLNFAHSVRQDSLLYVLFEESENLDCTLFIWNLNNGYLETFNIKLPLRIKVEQLAAYSSDVYFAGTTKGRDVVVHFDTEMRNCKIMPSLYEQQLSINQLWVHQQTEEVSAVVTRKHRQQNQLWLKTYTKGGFLQSDRQLNRFQKQSPTQIYCLGNDINNGFLLGYYYTFSADLPQGFWWQNVRPDDTTQAISYRPFILNKHFFSYKKPKAQEKIAKKIERKLAKGKEYKLYNRWQLNPPQSYKDSIFWTIGESYFLTRNSPSNPNRQYASPPSFDYRMSPDEYRYTHANVCVFDKTGQYLWDLSLNDYEHLKNKRSQNIFSVYNKDGLVLTFIKKNQLFFRHLQNGELLTKLDDVTIPMLYPDDKEEDIDDLTIADWHENRFLAWGTQEIKNKQTAGIALKRKVFFVCRLQYMRE